MVPSYFPAFYGGGRFSSLLSLNWIWYYLRFSIRSNKDPLLQIYETFCKKLAASGVTRHRSEGPASFAARASRLRQTDRPQIELITQMYIRLRYESVGSAAPTEELRQLTELVKAFEPTSG